MCLSVSLLPHWVLSRFPFITARDTELSKTQKQPSVVPYYLQDKDLGGQASSQEAQ